MFSKATLRRFAKKGVVGVSGALLPLAAKRLSFAPVLHVERLYVDTYFNNVLTFAREYLESTGSRIVATCITPESPMLRHQIGENSFSVDRYWDRISQLKEFAIIGLHGHFLRQKPSAKIVPMHQSFYDEALISDQIRRETEALEQRNLFNAGPRCYSGGWWFMNEKLSDMLSHLKYDWDFSVSDVKWNIVSTHHAQAMSSDEYGSGKSGALNRAVAISSIAQKNYPAAAFPKVLSVAAKGRRQFITFYGHDFDLPVPEAVQAVNLLHAKGFRFVEPRSVK